jgi:putative copper export protein
LSLPPPYDVTLSAWRWLEYAGLVGFIGVVVVRRLAAMPPALHWARAPMERWLGAAFIGGLGGLLTQSFHGAEPGVVGVVRVVAEGVALALCVYVRRWVVPPAILAAVLVAFGGHAARVNPAAGAIFADAIHVLSAGIWAGGILVLSYLRPPAGWGGDEGRAMIQRFGRVAFLAFAITALTGVLRATEELRGFGDLWGTPYGVVLSLKTAGVLVMVAMSALVWRRGFRYTRAEGTLALVVLAATALLAAFPMPPGQA